MCETPQRVQQVPFDLQRLQKIAGGGGHTLFLTDEGKVYSCGWNHRGQLGSSNTIDQSEIVAVLDVVEAHPLADIAHIASGWDSSAAIDRNGTLFVWGSNAFGQLGFAKSDVSIACRPIRLELPNGEKIKQVCFGLRHLAILTADNQVYFTGRIKFEEKCTRMVHNTTDLWKLNFDGGDIQLIATGQNHFLYVTKGKNGSRIYGFGDNRFGQAETILLDEMVSSLQSGWTNNGVLTDDGQVSLWGRNSYGQLSNSNVNVKGMNKLNCGQSVKWLHLGSEHGMTVTDEGSVFTWGWNEHGNCGNGSVENV